MSHWFIFLMKPVKDMARSHFTPKTKINNYILLKQYKANFEDQDF